MNPQDVLSALQESVDGSAWRITKDVVTSPRAMDKPVRLVVTLERPQLDHGELDLK